jgi:hypothetical protein
MKYKLVKNYRLDKPISLIIEKTGKNKNMLKKIKTTEYIEEEQIVILEFPFIKIIKHQIILKLTNLKTVLKLEMLKLLLKFQIQVSSTIINKYIYKKNYFQKHHSSNRKDKVFFNV